MNDENVKIIEINGVKMEVDLRHAKKIEHYKVGDRVKVLKKEYQSWTEHYGVIVDFAAFGNRPTIEILCVKPHGYSSDMSFVSFNKETSDIEIAPLNYLDEVFAKENVVERFNREIEKQETELHAIMKKKELFLRHFAKFFEPDAGKIVENA